MSTQQALMFLQLVRGSEGLRVSLNSKQDAIGLNELIALGLEHGMHFNAPQLREAFRIDWGLRALLNQHALRTGEAGCDGRAP